MTTTKDIASKLAVASVAVAMALMAFAPSAKAQTTDELQQMINDLLAQVAQLQGQVGQGATGAASGVCPFTWTRDLTSGSTGADVMKLQQFLNADPDTRVAAAGAGSVGMETEYYGPATAAAVSKFQVKYRSEVLSPSGLVNPTAYFGPSSRAKANGLCTSAPVTGDDTTTGDDTSDDDSSMTLQGEAAFDDFQADDADDDTLNEGDDDAPVGVFTFTFVDGDAEISRLDVKFDQSVTAARQWDALDTVQLWVDGDMVAEEDASSRSDYLGDEDNGIIRFSNLHLIAQEDKDLEVTVAVNLQNNLDTEEINSTYTVSIDSVRFFDADGVATTLAAADFPVTGEEAQFSIDAAGTNDSADIKKNSDNPDASTLKVDDKTTKESYDVFMFDIEVDQDSSDLNLDNAFATVTVTNSATPGVAITAGDVIDRVYLTIDGEKVRGDGNSTALAASIATSSSKEVLYTFDFDGYEFAADDTYEAVLTIEFKGQDDGDNYKNNVEVEASVDGDLWEMYGPDSDYVLSGSRSSETHTLATVVPDISGVDSSVTQANNVSNSGSIVFTFTVAADGDDVTLSRSALDAAASLTSSAASALAKPTPSLTKTSGDATPSGNDFVIADGDEAAFKLTYTFTTASSTNNGDYTINLLTVAGVEVDETSPSLPLAN
ncbi:hypothetical protein KC887_04945 [Candidatus Kaiserbacteria bacterium]|nr:hypothetical protein [Candidatus Kaiserbacteria bacterium]